MIYNSFVYIWKDSLNNKQYIGSHKGNINDGYISTSNYFNEQYSQRPEDFSRIIISLCETYEIARNQEAKLCNKLNVKNDPMFYNMHNGDGKFYCKGHTKLSKQKMKGRISSFKNKKHQEITKQKMSKNHANVTGKNNPMFGKTHSKETKRKMSEKALGNKNCLGRVLSEETKRKISEKRKLCHTINDNINSIRDIGINNSESNQFFRTKE